VLNGAGSSYANTDLQKDSFLNLVIGSICTIDDGKTTHLSMNSNGGSVGRTLACESRLRRLEPGAGQKLKSVIRSRRHVPAKARFALHRPKSHPGNIVWPH